MHDRRCVVHAIIIRDRVLQMRQQSGGASDFKGL